MHTDSQSWIWSPVQTQAKATSWLPGTQQSATLETAQSGLSPATNTWESTGVPAFADAYRTRHFAGRVRSCSMPDNVMAAADFDPLKIGEYDALAFPTDRTQFVARWVAAHGHKAYVRVVDGQLTGYGVIREAVSGFRVGPLVADHPTDAEALFDALVFGLDWAEVSLEAPEPIGRVAALTETRGLAAAYDTVRMYTHPTRHISMHRNYSIASFELG